MAWQGLVVAVVAVTFIVADKINRLTAGVIAVAMLGPMFGMTRWHAQINGRALDINGLWRSDVNRGLDQHRLLIDHGWWWPAA